MHNMYVAMHVYMYVICAHMKMHIYMYIPEIFLYLYIQIIIPPLLIMMTTTPTMLPIIISTVEESENSKDKIKSHHMQHPKSTF